MPIPQLKSRIASACFGLLGTALLVNSLVVHPQDKDDKPSATQSKETSSGASSGATTTQGGAAGGAKLNQTDERMIKQLAEANLAEISAGKLAQDKAQSEEVKSFAKKMVDDHTKALDELKQLAQSKGVTLPTEPNKQHMAMERKLQAQSGAKFDRQYMQQAGDRSHKETYKLLQRASSRAEDSDLKNFASKAIATVESHQQMAKETTSNLKSTAEGKSGGGSEGSSGKSKSGEESSGGSSSSGKSEGSSGSSGGGSPKDDSAK